MFDDEKKEGKLHLYPQHIFFLSKIKFRFGFLKERGTLRGEDGEERSRFHQTSQKTGNTDKRGSQQAVGH